MKKFAFSTLLVLAALFLCVPLSGQPNTPQEQKQAHIRKLLELTGSGKLGIQVMKQMIDSLRTSMPKVPQKFWDDFMKEAKPEQLVELIVPIYDKYLTDEDVQSLIQFYQSPVGKKVIQVLPQITQESMQAGQQWGAEIGQKVAEKLKAEGYE
jgi:uncharacterized protein